MQSDLICAANGMYWRSTREGEPNREEFLRAAQYGCSVLSRLARAEHYAPVPVVAGGEYSGPFAEAYRAGDTLRRLHEAEIRATLLEGGRFGEFLAREADVLLTAGMSEQLVRVLMQRTQEAIGDLREQLDRGERLGPRIDEVFYWLGQLQERTCGLAERLEQQANARTWWSSVAVSLGGAAMVVVDVAAGGPLAAAPPIGAAVMALSTAAGGQLIFKEVRGLFDRVFR